MRVIRVKISNLRAMEAAEFHFKRGFNLIVGVNGVGKSSVLDALGICLSAVVKHTNRLRTRVGAFTVDDIRVGAHALSVDCSVEIGTTEYSYLIHKPRQISSPNEKKAGIPHEETHNTPIKTDFIGKAPARATGNESEGRSLAVLFSTNRAVPSERTPSKRDEDRGVDAAFGDALTSRELRLGDFAEWMRMRKAVKAEAPAADRILTAFESAFERFLPGYSNLRLQSDDHPRLLIDRGTTTVAVRQLSDGERGILALVLDLTRRLAQANPNMPDPAAQAEAVVLIDEIDLHLHPLWQRQIVRNLTAAFPRCQFIATTHSPQVIGEVEHDRIQIIANGQVYSPTHSFGVDSSRVLEEIMEVDPRTSDIQALLSQISAEIGNLEFMQARVLLAKLVERLGEDDPEVTRVQTLLDFMEGNE